MVQHVVYGHLVNIGFIEGNGRHRMSCGIKSETFLVNLLSNLLHASVQVIAEIGRISVHPVETEHIPFLFVQYRRIFLDKRHEQRMRLDDDAGMVRSPVLCLGTVIGNVSLAIPFA